MRVDTVPTDVGTGVYMFFPTTFRLYIDPESADEGHLIVLEFPQAAPSILSSSCPHEVVVAPFNLDNLLVMSLDREDAGEI